MSRTITYSVSEYGQIISNASIVPGECSTLKKLILPDDLFQSLVAFVKNDLVQESVFRIEYKKGRETITPKKFVGVIQFVQGYQIEILPKVLLSNSIDETKAVRGVLVDLLSHIKGYSFLKVGIANLLVQKDYPILEVFISAFLAEFEAVLRDGLQSDYEIRKSNRNSLKGKLLISDQLKRNILPYRFYCQYLEYSIDNPVNRIVKATLAKLLSVSNDISNHDRIRFYLDCLASVSTCTNLQADLNKIGELNRTYLKYKVLLEWARVFLANQSFTSNSGKQINISVLFPMQKVFEDYITFHFKKHSSGYVVKGQEQLLYLTQHESRQLFQLKPDVVVYKQNLPILIIDAKWKVLDSRDKSGKYGISEKDMYQLYAYGKQYNSRFHSNPHLILLYPENENFTSPLSEFLFDSTLSLTVMPFSFNQTPGLQIDRILNQFTP